MTKASISLPNGTKVEIDGTPEEVAQLLSLYGQNGSPPSPRHPDAPSLRKKKPRKPRRTPAATGGGPAKADPSGLTSADLAQVVNTVKSCDEAEAIEKRILDKTSQVDRTLLPLYVVHDYMSNKFALTSGDINKITTQLGIPISTANASTTLSGTASRYVMADSVRRAGVPVRYKISRRGQQYLKSVITGQTREDKE